MDKDVEEIKKLQQGFLVVFFLVIVLSGGSLYINYKINSLKEQVNQEGIYDYCVEWGSWIYREHLFFNCYDIETKEKGCAYEIDKQNNLEVYSFVDNKTTVYLCSKLLKSTKVVNYAG